MIERNGIEEQVPLHEAVSRAGDAGTADLVLVLVKAYDTAAAVGDVLPAVCGHTLLLTLQNGLGNVEAIAGLVPEGRILAGTTAHGATLLGPGRIRHAGTGQTVIGSMTPQGAPQARRLQQVLQAAGIETTVTDTVESVLWGKLLVNVGINALTAVMRVRNGRVGDCVHLRDVMRRAVREGAAVAERLGIVLPYQDPVARTEEVCRATAENISSMHQDIAAGRRTEIESINGIVAAYGQRLGVPAPVNRMLTSLVSALERLTPS